MVANGRLVFSFPSTKFQALEISKSARFEHEKGSKLSSASILKFNGTLLTMTENVISLRSAVSDRQLLDIMKAKFEKDD